MNTTKPQPKRGTPDFQLLILTLLLVGFGLIMVFSSSSSLAVFNEKFNNDPRILRSGKSRLPSLAHWLCLLP